MMFWENAYLRADHLAGFEQYKVHVRNWILQNSILLLSKLHFFFISMYIMSQQYSAKDTSPLSQYVMHPFWNAAVKVSLLFYCFVWNIIFLFCYSHRYFQCGWLPIWLHLLVFCSLWWIGPCWLIMTTNTMLQVTLNKNTCQFLSGCGWCVRLTTFFPTR